MLVNWDSFLSKIFHAHNIFFRIFFPHYKMKNFQIKVFSKYFYNVVEHDYKNVGKIFPQFEMV